MPTRHRPSLAGLGIATLLLLLVPPAVARAGAWTQEEGGWFLKLGYDRWFTDRRFDGNGVRVAYREVGPPAFVQQFRAQALRVYGEYGLTEAWTAIVGGGYEWLASEGDGQVDRNSGFSDLWLHLKRRLLLRPVVVSVAAELKLPLAARGGGAPALGTDHLDYGGRLALGRGFGALYAGGEVGYRVRGGALEDQVPFEAEAGWSPRDDLQLRTGLRGTGTVRLGGVPAGPFDPALADSRDVRASVGLVLRGEPLDVVFDVERALGGRNALAGTRLAFSVWHTRP